METKREAPLHFPVPEIIGVAGLQGKRFVGNNPPFCRSRSLSAALWRDCQKISYGYDGLGRLSTARSGHGNSLQNATTVFDILGNLTARTDSAAGINENFSYDALNRLTGTPQGSVAYDAAGNITQREGKNYTYLSGSHRMSAMSDRSYQYDANGNVTAITDAQKGNQTLTYGIHNLPDALQKGSTTLAYQYNAADGRLRETSVTDAGVTVTWYLGGFEVKHNQDGGIEERHYLGTPSGPVGIHTRTYGEQAQGIAPGSRARYWIKDHLGSVVAIADEQGSLVQRYRFDAWGRRTQSQLADGEIAEERGYTGHEQMTEVDLVHMNGRIYDPATGRMLQADPIIQSPFDGQNYNRYSYVLNNPLSLTDPSGFSFWTRIRKPLMMVAAAVATYFTAGAAMVAYAGAIGTTTGLTVGTVAVTGASCSLTGFTLSASGAALASVAAGAVSGLVGGGNLQSGIKGAIFASYFFAAGSLADGAGQAFGSVAGQATRVAAHAAVGCASASSAGGSCGSGAASAGFAEVLSPLAGDNLVGRSLVGAASAAVSGGNVGQGAVIAGLGYLFNHCAHGNCDTEFEQFMYDWWPGYKAGTCISNGGDCTLWEWADFVSSFTGIAGKGVQLLKGGQIVKTAGQIGKEGEMAVREVFEIGEKSIIKINGRSRIPDGITRYTLSEVKNVKSLSYTQQLRDYTAYTQTNKIRFDLYTRADTQLSGPLRQAINEGLINHRFIP